MLLKICAAREDATTVDEAKAINDAKALYKAGEGKIGTDDKVFIDLFGRCSWAHLKAVSTQCVPVFLTIAFHLLKELLIAYTGTRKLTRSITPSTRLWNRSSAGPSAAVFA